MFADLHATELQTEIASGGAAAAAYARLQDEELEPAARSAIEQALKRYCELDTLAMAMVIEAWQDWCRAEQVSPTAAAAAS